MTEHTHIMNNPNADLEALIAEPPEAQLAWFRDHHGLRMNHSEWSRFYCASLQHKGLCRTSCEQDEEYYGEQNFDEHCCCISSKSSHGGRSEAS